MSTLNYANESDLHHTHGVSAQRHVAETHDLASDTSHHHSDDHLNNDSQDAKVQKEEVIYSEGTTSEKSTAPSQVPHDQEARRRHADKINQGADVSDTEKGSLSLDRLGEEDPRTHTSTFYARYRIYLHLVIWLFFTGLVFQALVCMSFEPALASQKNVFFSVSLSC